MKYDRELLELAAKAAGIHIHSWNFAGYAIIAGPDGRPMGWNPLLDDGDTLRLALALNIDIQPREFGCYASICAMGITVQEIGDKGPAARRAVVRAAVEYEEATS